jgi:hypothetical protein
MRKASLAIAAVALSAAALAGCGSTASTGQVSIATPAQRQFGPLNPANNEVQASAGQVAYTPTGKIIASDGFNPATDGFDVENYGNLLPAASGIDQPVVNTAPAELTPQIMQQMFGNAVCADSQCDLTPEAQAWMDQQNQGMAGGHCYGFSDAAEQFFAGNANPSSYGASTVPQLNVLGNVSLQSFIAENWAYQDLPSVQKDRIMSDPNTILDDLTKDLVPNPSQLYTLIIFMADGSGGHAVTPFAIEDNGNGQFHILIYDNNFPGVTRAIAVDTTTDTWTYTGGINPSDTTELYQGNAKTQSIGLDPVSPALGVQPWTFGTGTTGTGTTGTGTTGTGAGTTGTGTGTTGAGQTGAGSTTGPTGTASPSALRAAANGAPAFLVDDVTGVDYDDIYLDGGDVEHGHLLITNPDGQQVGYLDGSLVNTIPGAIIENHISDEDWAESSEPDYLVPDGVQYTITLDGSTLRKQDPDEDVGIVAPGYELEVDNINLNPGEKDTLAVSADGSSVSYTASSPQAPDLFYGVSDATDDYIFGVGGDNVPADGTIEFDLPVGGSTFTVSTAGTGDSTVELTMLLEDEDASGSHTFGHGGIPLDDGDTAALDFGGWSPGQSMSLVITHAGNSQTQSLDDQGSAVGITGYTGASGATGASGSTGTTGNTGTAGAT